MAEQEPRPEWGEPHRKEITWWDTAHTSGHLAGLTGLEFLQAMSAGEIAPAAIGRTLGFSVTSAEQGRVEFQATPDTSVYNPIGTVHGGFACTLLDSVLGCAVQSTLPAGFGYTSIEIKVNYLRSITEASGTLTARGWVTKPGRRVAFSDGEIVDANGKVLATATGSCLVMDLQG